MSVIRSIPDFVRSKLRIEGGVYLPPDKPIEILERGDPATLLPGQNVAGYNHCLIIKVGDYCSSVLLARKDLTTHWGQICSNTQLARKLILTKEHVTCIHDILDDINVWSQLGFMPSEISNDPIPDGTYNEITINCSPECLWFTGKLVIPLHKTTMISDGKPIIQLDVTPKLHNLRTPLTDAVARHPGGVLTYADNFTQTADLLKMKAAGMCWALTGAFISDTDGAKLAEIIRTVDNNIWEYSSTAKGYNLYNAVIAYNGPVEGYVDRIGCSYGNYAEDHYGHQLRSLNKPRQDQKYVLAIIPNPTYSTKLTMEPIFIHYGGERSARIERPPVHHWPLRNTRENFGTDPKQRPWTNRGKYAKLGTDAEASFVLSCAALYSNNWGISTIGADLPVDKDFTISFDIAHGNAFRYNLSNMRFMDIFNTAKNEGTLAFIGTDTTPQIGLTANDRTDAFYASNLKWPHWHTVTFTRSGDQYLIYVNCELVGTHRATGAEIKVINAIDMPQNDHPMHLRDFRYFDYALDAAQVIDAAMGRMDAQKAEVAVSLPKPKHYWPLMGSVAPGDDTAQVPLNPVFSFKSHAKVTDGQYAYNSVQGGSELGVSLPTDKDFTLSYDLIFMDPPSGYTQMGHVFSGNGSHLISYYGTSPELAGSTAGDLWSVGDNNVSTFTNQVVRQQFVKRGNLLSLYINGRYVRSQYWTDVATTFWNKFGGPTTLSNYMGIRKLRYYESCLTEAQLVVETLN